MGARGAGMPLDSSEALCVRLARLRLRRRARLVSAPTGFTT